MRKILSLEAFKEQGLIEKFADILSKREKIPNKHARNVVIYDAHKKHGYTFKDIVDYLGINYT